MIELKSLARAATPGPWIASDPPECDGAFAWVDSGGRDYGTMCTVYATLCPEKPLANAAYIAALSPERVLQLLDVIEVAKAMRDAYVKAWRTDDPLPKSVAAFDAALAALDKEQK